MTPPAVWGTSEIAEHCGVSRINVYRWAKRPDFPQPRILAIGSVWDAAEIKAWKADRDNVKKHGRVQALKLYRKDPNINAIAREIGVNRNTARAWLVDCGEIPAPVAQQILDELAVPQ